MIEYIHSVDFTNISKSIQAVLISLGIFVGGCWALFAFIAQRNEWHIKRQPLIKLSLRVEQRLLPDDPRFYIHAVVEAKNEGNLVDYLHFTEHDHFSITHFHITDEGERFPVDQITRVLERSRNRRVDFVTLLPGSTVELPFWLLVPEPGLYHVRFYFRPNAQQISAFKAAGHLRENDSIVISVNKYFVVDPVHTCNKNQA